MVNTSRILTVSYGTFSCTLEGFDDPFSTMKSIAEYFRDLAADDRYFGAEPPTPDAEMLHRIAEREVRKRVEARVSENGVVLRQAEADEAPAAVGLLADADREAEKAAARAAADEKAAREAEEAEAARRAAEEAAAREAEEAETARIAAEEEAARKAAEEEAARAAAEAEAARKAADEEAARKAAQDEADRRVAEQETERRNAEAAARAARLAEPEIAAGSVTDKLMRLRAVVDNSRVSEADDYLEDEHAEEYFSYETDAFDEILEDALTAEPDAAEAEDEGLDSAAISAVLGSLGRPAVMEEPNGADEEAETDIDSDEIDSIFSALDEEAEADLDTQEDAETPTEAVASIDEDEESAEAAPDATAALTEPGDQSPTVLPRRPIARVIKVRRPAGPLSETQEQGDDEAAAGAEAEIEDIAEIDADVDGFEVPGESTLSEQDEADLAAELAEVARDAEDSRSRVGEGAVEKAAYGDTEDGEDVEFEDEAPEPTAADVDAGPLAIDGEEEPADRITGRRATSRTAFDDHAMSDTDGAIDRILEKTNTQLQSGEASRRRSAIQHLKQAVQATRADRSRTSEEEEAELAEDPYRADLARVVRPRRPETAGEAEGKRPPRRLAPLVLVSEQRIDTPQAPAVSETAATAAPVRPRRVAKGNLAVAPVEELDDDDDYEDDVDVLDDDRAALEAGLRAYLEQVNAESHEEIVEAAVAYLTQEVGRANVVRPQLMALVRSAMPDVSREEGLRAFGKLLRDGRIDKVKRGVFVLSDRSRFYDADA